MVNVFINSIVFVLNYFEKLRPKRKSYTSKIKKTMSVLAEPMTLDSEDELCLYPIKRPEIMQNYEEQLSRFWTHHEIDHTADRKDWERMNPDEQYYISKSLAFFANSDNAVMKNINTRYHREIKWPEVHLAMAQQAAMEGIHVLSYNNMIESVISNKQEKVRLFEAVKNDPIISEKIAWITKWASDDSVPLSQCFAAQCFSEGIGFSPSFASMFWLRKNQRCPGICFGNEKIVEDESLHVKLYGSLYRLCVNKLSKAKLESMCREFVEIEHRFVDQALPYNLSGMNKELMKQYVCRVADSVMEVLGEAVIYNVANPFPWMDKIGLLNKTNFFEKRVGEYRKPQNETSIRVLQTSDFDADTFDL
jgi:ribonucleotide reductase beta subunit family protein with ferritin-like domain